MQQAMIFCFFFFIIVYLFFVKYIYSQKVKKKEKGSLSGWNER